MKRVKAKFAAAIVAAMVLTGSFAGAGTWTITDLGQAQDANRMALNDNGWAILGNRILSPGPSGYTVTPLFSTQGNANNFALWDINNDNTVLGMDRSVSDTAFTWKNGVRTDLPKTPDYSGYVSAYARGINDSGQVVGNTGDTAVIWTPNGSGGYTINPLGVDLGWTIGSGDGAAINNPGFGLMSQVYNSYRTGYSQGIGLTTIFPEMAGYTPVGTAINDLNQAVGYAVYQPDAWSASRAFIWQGSSVTFLSVDNPVDGRQNHVANALNENGDVVGYAWYGPYDARAVLWTADTAGGWTPIDLNTLLTSGSDFYQLSQAWDINEKGQILGMGSVNGDSTPHAFLLTPAVPVPGTFWLLSSGLIGLAGIGRRKTMVID